MCKTRLLHVLIPALMLAAGALGHAVIAKDYSVAYKLMIISDPDFLTEMGWKKGISSYMPIFIQKCFDVESETRSGDMLVVAYKLIQEAGLEKEEKLFDFVNTMFGMTSQIYNYAEASKLPVRCAEIWVHVCYSP